MERKLATIKTIDNVTPIEGADKIVCYHIGGWTIVDQKGLYKSGDRVLYIEVDACLPLSNPNFAFLEKFSRMLKDGKLYHRLKTIKLKGQVSQGLIVPISILENQELKEDFDYAESLGIFKYEAPIPAQLSGKATNWPSWIEKTDEERINNVPQLIGNLNPEDWIAYQKIDGTSCTFFYDDKLHVCSRNFELVDGGNDYYKVVNQLTLEIDNTLVPLVDILPQLNTENSIFIFQGELFGEGIQKNPIGIKGHQLKLFTIQEYDKEKKISRRLSPNEIQEKFSEIYEQLWVPKLDIKLPQTMEEILSQVNGLTNQVEGGNNSQIEGVVWRHKLETWIKIPRQKKIDISKIPEDKREMVLEKIGNLDYEIIKGSFKVISTDYLLGGHE